MQTIVEGKSAVLSFLEDEALKRTDEKPGNYMLIRDDAGSLILFIEGFAFIGSGSASLGGRLLDVVDGRIAKVQIPS